MEVPLSIDLSEDHPEPEVLACLSTAHTILESAQLQIRDALVQSLLTTDTPHRNRELTAWMSSIRIVRQGLEDMHAEMVEDHTEDEGPATLARKVMDVISPPEDTLRELYAACTEQSRPRGNFAAEDPEAEDDGVVPRGPHVPPAAGVVMVDLDRDPQPHDEDFFSGLPGKGGGDS